MAKKLAKPLNTIEPRKGMTLQIYMSRKDVGSGLREYLVLGVSHRYVTLFYPPGLLVLRIKRKAWPFLHAVSYKANIQTLIANVEKRLADMHVWGKRVGKVNTEKALALLRTLQ